MRKFPLLTISCVLCSMPFTFAHAAIVLPLKRLFPQEIFLLALIIGSFTPDFEYFFRLRVHSECSHSMTGILLFNLPAGAFLLLLYLYILQKPTLNAAPNFIRKRIPLIQTPHLKNPKIIAIVGLGLIVGIASHLFWDAFTHETGYFAQKIDWLQSNQFLLGRNIQGFKIVQHGSTLIGSTIILLVFFRGKTFDIGPPKNRFSFGLIWLLTLLGVLFLRWSLSSKFDLGTAVVTTIAAFFYGITLASLITYRKN